MVVKHNELEEDRSASGAAALALVDKPDARQPFIPELAPDDQQRVDSFVGRASADTTLRAYKSDWALFCAWCGENGYRPLPAAPATVAAFLTLLAEVGFTPRTPRRTKLGKVIPRKEPVALGRATIGRRLAAIVFAHRAAGVEPPTSQPDAARLEKAMRGIRKVKRDEMPDKKRPADGDVLRDMVRAITGEDLRAYRDRALLAFGMAGAFRRSELVRVTVAQVAQDTCATVAPVSIQRRSGSVAAGARLGCVAKRWRAGRTSAQPGTPGSSRAAAARLRPTS